MPAPPTDGTDPLATAWAESRKRFLAACKPPANVRESAADRAAREDRAHAAIDEHEVHDLATAQILDAEDFKEIGIKVGTRKKLLERLASSTSEA